MNRESIQVPAGTFNAFRIQGRGSAVGPWGNAQYEINLWRDPGRLRVALVEEERTVLRGQITRATRTELVGYKEG